MTVTSLISTPGRVLRAAALLAALGPAAASAQSRSGDTVRVVVDGHVMQLLVSGSGPGPTVVFEAGHGSTSRAWTTLRARLGAFTRVVAYDRPGLGGSAMCSRPRDARTIAQELRAALRAAGIEPPFVLVGGSLGGFYVRVFAGMYPNDVTGLVLVDPPPEDFYARAKREQPAVYARFDAEDSVSSAQNPPGQHAEDDMWDTTLAQVRASDSTLVAPVLLLSAVRTDLEAIGPIWQDEQRRWVARQRRATFTVVEGARHAIHRDRPDDVIEAIRRARNFRPGNLR
jgi:pimeloyl-ACP methyl ester carboxylesterase